MSIKIAYTIDPSLREPACTTADGRILVSPLVPEPYRDILAYHERVEWVETISHNPPVLRAAPDGDIVIDTYLFPSVARHAHEQACKEEKILARCWGVEEYSPWRVRMLIGEMKKAGNEGRLNPELHDIFFEDISLFSRN